MNWQFCKRSIVLYFKTKNEDCSAGSHYYVILFGSMLSMKIVLNMYIKRDTLHIIIRGGEQYG